MTLPSMNLIFLDEFGIDDNIVKEYGYIRQAHLNSDPKVDQKHSPQVNFLKAKFYFIN
jgi:hypothetical protein